MPSSPAAMGWSPAVGLLLEWPEPDAARMEVFGGAAVPVVQRFASRPALQRMTLRSCVAVWPPIAAVEAAKRLPRRTLLEFPPSTAPASSQWVSLLAGERMTAPTVKREVRLPS